MTAGYRDTDDGSAPETTVPVSRPGPLPPRTEAYPSHSTGPVWPPAGQPTPPPAYPTVQAPLPTAPVSAAAQPGPVGPGPVGPGPGYGPPPIPAQAQPEPPAMYPTSQYPVAPPPTSGLPLSAAPASGGYPLDPAYPPPAPYGGVPAQPRPAGRSRVLLVLVILLVLATVGQTVALVLLNGKADKAAKAQRTAQAADAKRMSDLDSRIKMLEQQAAASLDPQAVAAAVLPSVFKVDAGNFSGTAFVVSATSDGTNLITNYHVVADLYESGGRQVTLEHDNKRYKAKITKVNPDDDVARLESDDTFPALGVETAEVVTGQPVVVVGAPLGLAQSVTTGVVSAIRDDIPGENGRTYIQFSAPINPGNSGGPVVDAQKKVVGIATAKARDAEGIGLAIPISVACKDLSIC